MKGLLKKICSFLVVLVFIVGIMPSYDALIYAFEVFTAGDYQYYLLENGTAEIYGYNGNETILQIPEKLDGYSVSGVGPRAFNGCSSLTEIYISKNITKIDELAFASCDNISAFLVDEENEYFSSFDGILFNKDLTTLVCYPPNTDNTQYSVPDSVTSIGTGAFYESNLIEISLPDGLLNIGEGAFAYCENLTGIQIPNSVTLLDAYAFIGCINMLEIEISQSITYIGVNTFTQTGLKNIVIPNNVTHIYPGAFCLCENLTTVTVPKNVKCIDGAFWGCENLTEVIICNGLIEITSETFCDCFNLTKIIIPNSVTYIGEDAFASCENLTIYGYRNSYAETYSNEHNIPFVELTKEKGDVDGDGIINATDALYSLKHSAKLSILDDISSADVNKDGTITAEDALLILKYAAKLINSFE